MYAATSQPDAMSSGNLDNQHVVPSVTVTSGAPIQPPTTSDPVDNNNPSEKKLTTNPPGGEMNSQSDGLDNIDATGVSAQIESLSVQDSDKNGDTTLKSSHGDLVVQKELEPNHGSYSHTVNCSSELKTDDRQNLVLHHEDSVSSSSSEEIRKTLKPEDNFQPGITEPISPECDPDEETDPNMFHSTIPGAGRDRSKSPSPAEDILTSVEFKNYAHASSTPLALSVSSSHSASGSTPIYGPSSVTGSLDIDEDDDDDASEREYLENLDVMTGSQMDNMMQSEGSTRISDGIEVPIVGYEIMEQRARFTVFKIHVKKSDSEAWFVFRRYTDFVALNEKLRQEFPSFRLSLPPKKWFGNNYDKKFLEYRIIGLQAFLQNVIGHRQVSNSQPVRDFFCFDDPPGPHESLEESRALCETLEEECYHLRRELQERDSKISLLEDEIALHKSQIDALMHSLRIERSLNAARRASPSASSQRSDNSLIDGASDQPSCPEADQAQYLGSKESCDVGRPPSGSWENSGNTVTDELVVSLDPDSMKIIAQGSSSNSSPPKLS